MRRLIFILCAIIGVSQAQTIQYIGAPTTTVISRGNFRTDSIFYLPKRSKAPTDTAALRYQISDSSLYAWTGSQWRKVGADADTLVYSTRAWRQKGDDSLAALINLKVNISDTGSMLTPYLRKVDTTAMLSPYYRSAAASAALALKLNISDTSSMLGNYVRHAGYGLTKSGQSFIVDTLNIATRAWRQKGLDSLAALEVSGSGTTNYVPKFTAGSTIGNSQIQDNGSGVGIGVNPDSNLKLYVRPNSTTGTAIYSDNGANSGFVVKYNGAITNIGNDFNAPLALFTNNTERLRIFANGRVFIGASPTDAGYQLDINGTLRSVNGANFATTSGNVGVGITADNPLGSGGTYRNLMVGNGAGYGAFQGVSTATAAGSTLAAFMGGTTGASSSFKTAGYMAVELDGTSTTNATGRITFTVGQSTGAYIEAMRITSSGELLINTQSDAGDYKLQVAGNIYNTGSAVLAATSGNVGIGTASPANNGANTTTLTINGTTQGILQLQNAGTKYFEFYGNGTDTRFENVAGNDLTFRNGSTVNARITSAGELLINTTTDAGDYKLQVAGNIYGSGLAVIGNAIINTNSPFVTGANIYTNGQSLALGTQGANLMSFFTNNTERGRINSAGEWIIDASGTDAGDYKLQVVGNARIGTGKLDIASNTVYGLGVARSGTSEVAGQIYNSNGILYLGAESSAGGQIFSGSSAYAAVIGSGANYPLQFATNNATRATINTNGELLINTLTDNGDFKLQVNGNGYITGNLQINPSANTTGIYMPSMSWTGSNASAAVNVSGTLNTTGAPSLIYVDVSDVASGTETNFMQFVNSDTKFRVTKQGDIQTAAPSGGTARKWKLGSVVATSVQLDTANYVEVEINGTFYRLAIVTPL